MNHIALLPFTRSASLCAASCALCLYLQRGVEGMRGSSQTFVDVQIFLCSISFITCAGNVAI